MAHMLIWISMWAILVNYQEINDQEERCELNPESLARMFHEGVGISGSAG